MQILGLALGTSCSDELFQWTYRFEYYLVAATGFYFDSPTSLSSGCTFSKASIDGYDGTVFSAADATNSITGTTTFNA
jgi:hypothetical protein